MDERSSAIQNSKLREEWLPIVSTIPNFSVRNLFWKHLFPDDDGQSVVLKDLVLPIDPDLSEIDPWADDLDTVTQRKIWNECKNNILYFLGRVLKVHQKDNGEDSLSYYWLNKTNIIAHSICTEDIADRTIIRTSRRSGKTMFCIAQTFWFKLFTSVKTDPIGCDELWVPVYIHAISAMPNNKRHYENFTSFKAFTDDGSGDASVYMRFYARGQVMSKATISYSPRHCCDAATEDLIALSNRQLGGQKAYQEVTFPNLVNAKYSVSHGHNFVNGQNFYEFISDVAGEYGALYDKLMKEAKRLEGTYAFNTECMLR